MASIWPLSHLVVSDDVTNDEAYLPISNLLTQALKTPRYHLHTVKENIAKKPGLKFENANPPSSVVINAQTFTVCTEIFAQHF
ncbi:unnamed protein product [Spodoptera exigua]|nr:unnamed protein product [Spodoptera exigua]